MTDANTQDLDRRLRASSGGDIGAANALAQAITRQGGNPSQSPTLRPSFDYARRRVNENTALEDERALFDHAPLECTVVLAQDGRDIVLGLPSRKPEIWIPWDVFCSSSKKTNSQVLTPTYAAGRLHFLYNDIYSRIHRVTISSAGEVTDREQGHCPTAYLVPMPHRGEVGMVGYALVADTEPSSWQVRGVDTDELIIADWPLQRGSILSVKQDNQVLVRQTEHVTPQINHSYLQVLAQDGTPRSERVHGSSFFEEGAVYAIVGDTCRMIWPGPMQGITQARMMRSLGDRAFCPRTSRLVQSPPQNRVDNEQSLARCVEGLRVIYQEIPYSMMRGIVKAYNQRRPDDPKVI